MKTPKLIIILSIFFQISANAQIQRYDYQDSKSSNSVFEGETILNNQQSQVCISQGNSQLIFTNNYIDKYDKLVIYNMQGGVVIKQSITGNAARIDVSVLIERVYLLVLRSSSTMKEKSMKMVVSR